MIRQRLYASRHFLARAVLFATSALCFSAPAWAEDYVVIANKSVASASISRADMQAIFLGDKTKWDDGKPVGFAVMEDGDSHKAFMQDVMSKTPAQFDNYWKRLVFTGKASAPKTFSDAGKLMEFVATNPGTVGYVPADKADGSVKTISIK